MIYIGATRYVCICFVRMSCTSCKDFREVRRSTAEVHPNFSERLLN